MSKQIIIDWQRDGLFVAMGSRRGGSVTVETLVPTGWEGGANGSSTAISTQLFALAKKLDLSKAEATIIAPREVLEFRTLTVPRGEPDEVPDMVRFQAQRQMANIGDTWALDYILLPDSGSSEGISALAATISPAHMAEIEGTCSDLGLTLTRVVARPVEIARWGVSLGSLASTEASMVLAVSQNHADILMINQGNLVQVRGTRLPEAPATMASALVAEVRRSIMAAASVMSSQSVNKIVLIAAPDIAERLESPIAQATGASVAIIDPASILPSSLPERHELAQKSSSRLAAIAGVLCDPTPDKQTVIDLKNWKRREPKKVRVREYSIAGGVAAVLAIMGLYWWWSSHAQLDMEIANAIKLEKEKAFIVQQTSKALKQRDDVNGFLAGSVNWLDELSHIASHVPPAEDVMLTTPTFDSVTERTGKTISTYGKITVTAVGKDPQSLNRIREGLSDKEHVVNNDSTKQLPQKSGDYAWTEKESIRVYRTGWDPIATQPKTTQSKPATTTVAPKSASNNAAADSGTAGKSEATAPERAARTGGGTSAGSGSERTGTSRSSGRTSSDRGGPGFDRRGSDRRSSDAQAEKATTAPAEAAPSGAAPSGAVPPSAAQPGASQPVTPSSEGTVTPPASAPATPPAAAAGDKSAATSAVTLPLANVSSN